MRKALIALAVLTVFSGSVYAQSASEGELRNIYWSKIEKRVERALESGRENRSDYSSLLADLKIVYPEEFAKRVTYEDLYILKARYYGHIEDGEWALAVTAGANLRIIDPSHLSPEFDELRAMKMLFQANRGKHPSWALNYAAKLNMLNYFLQDEIAADLGEINSTVGGYIRSLVCRYHQQTSLSPQDKYWYRVWPSSFISSYSSLEQLSLSGDVCCEYDQQDWDRLYRELYRTTGSLDWHDSLGYLADAMIAEKGFNRALADSEQKANAVAQSTRDEYYGAHWEYGKLRITSGFRPKGFWSIGLGSARGVGGTDVAFDAWRVGAKVMFFRLSKNWRASGVGIGTSKFSSSSYPGEDMGWETDITITPLQWKKLAWEITPYKKQIYNDVGLGRKTHGVATFLTINF